MIQALFTIFNFIVYTAGIIILLSYFLAFIKNIRIMATKLNASWAGQYGVGSWAVVTGCTGGIGKAFAFQLAHLGFNLVLISRKEADLQKLSNQISAKYPSVHFIIVVANPSEFSQKMYADIYHKFDHVDVSILVNNVGSAHLKQFHLFTDKQIEQEINLNIRCITYLTSKVVPHFLQRKYKSAIINLSSQSINCPLKDLSVYAATKAYDDIFSRGLSQEYLGKIDVVSVRPCIVSTPATKFSSDWTACSSQDCARGSLKALGKSKVTAGHWTHNLQSAIAVILGEDLTRFVANMKLKDIQANKKQ